MSTVSTTDTPAMTTEFHSQRANGYWLHGSM
jgi:hypothetical protein